ncbi:MAG: S8 family serine peptidase [Candidatus Hodarchaeota archaeon]
MKIVKILFALAVLFLISSPDNISPVQGFIPNDPEGDPWHLDTIGIYSVWDHGYDFRSTPGAVGLCIIGYPIINDQNGDLNITEKASFAWNSDFTSYLPYPSEYANSHEASIASIAASTINNSKGVAGIVNAPLYTAWPWGHYPDDDFEFNRMYLQQLIDIFDWCSSFGKVVISMSFIAHADALEITDPVLIELQSKVSELYESGKTLFFAASGNYLGPLYPADIPQSLPFTRVVGRINRGGLYESGGYGTNLFLVAPAGVPAYDQTSDSYGVFGGASCSAPIVAASAALLWNQFPWASNMQIEDALCQGATDILDSGWDEKSGFGILNVEKSRCYLIDNSSSSNSCELSSKIGTDEAFSATSGFRLSDVAFTAIASLIILAILIKRRN